MRARLFSASLLTLAALTTGAEAQTHPNLSGTWILKPEESDFAGMMVPTSRTDVVVHQDTKLTIKRTVVSSQGTVSSDLVFGVDGKPWANTMGTNQLSSVLHWEADTLVMVTSISTPQGDATLTDRITLSADGKTMTQARNVSTGGEALQQKIVLVKQP